MDLLQTHISVNQKVNMTFPLGIELYVKREDLIHPFVSGNKFRKLKYNLIEAKSQKQKTLLTFGGAYSNHIAALAAAAHENGLYSIGVIRGDELASKILENPTLKFAQSKGMQFEFVTREQYRDKTQESFIDQLQKKYGDFYLVPEGGTNELAVKGCEEILTTEDEVFDYICCSMGTGGTVSGLRKSAKSHQLVLGFSSLKTDYLKNEIDKFAPNTQGELILEYHFGGYGKVNNELIQFINNFYSQTNIPLDPIYTGKTMFGIMDLIQKKYFKPQSKILMIHTGGLQGIQGMNQHLEIKKLPTIQIYGK